MKPPLMRTYTGRLVDPWNVLDEDLDALDIAHALAHQCRYGGHVARHYSVAEHSVLLARHFLAIGATGPTEFGRRLARWALLHDAAETFLPDLPAPVKRRLPQYSEASHAIDVVICRRFGVDAPASTRHVVDTADKAIVEDEMRALMARPYQRGDGLDITVHGWPALKARDEFLALGAELGLWINEWKPSSPAAASLEAA